MAPTLAPENRETGARGAGAGERSEAPATRLDEATISYGGHWSAALYEVAGEGTLVYSPPQDPREPVRPGDGADPERAAREAARRAATTLRRFCAHHGLDRLGSLTYRCRRCKNPNGCHCEQGPDRPTDVDLDDVVADIARFRRRLNERLGYRPPIAIVIEHHDDGTLHVHLAYGRFLSKSVVASCWGLGFVDLRKFRAKGLESAGARERCRMVASYMSAYLKKDFTEGHQFGRHRYSTTRGLVPVPRRERFQRADTARAWWLIVMGGEKPATTWSSTTAEGWQGPPVEIAYWSGDPPPSRAPAPPPKQHQGR